MKNENICIRWWICIKGYIMIISAELLIGLIEWFRKVLEIRMRRVRQWTTGVGLTPSESPPVMVKCVNITSKCERQSLVSSSTFLMEWSPSILNIQTLFLDSPRWKKMYSMLFFAKRPAKEIDTQRKGSSRSKRICIFSSRVYVKYISRATET